MSRRYLTAGLAASSVLATVLLMNPQESVGQNAPKANRGRLPDGRAYRIDAASGMRLSDYIAELEVTADDLRRQMVALEDEVSERRRQVEEYERTTGVKLATKIKETTLVDKSSLPPARSAPISCSPDDPMVASLRARVKELEAGGGVAPVPGSFGGPVASGAPVAPVAPGAPVAPAPGTTQQPQTACDWNSPANPLRSQLAETSEQGKRQAALLGEQLASVNNQLLEKNRKIEELESKAASVGERSEPRARQTPQAVPVVSETVASTASNNERVELVNALNKLQGLVIKRKDLLDNVKKTGKGVTVPIQPLVTRGRVTLDDLRTNVQRFQTGHDSTGIRATLAEIEQILHDDIAVLNRLSNN